MRFFLPWMLAVLLIGARSNGQDLPRPSETGVKGLVDLIDTCAKAGGLQLLKPGDKRETLPPIADLALLRKGVEGARDRLTSEVRDTLIGIRQAVSVAESPTHLALLEEVGRATNDERVLAFTALFAGDAEWQAGRFDRSEKAFRESRRLFDRIGDVGWGARSRHQQAVLYETAGLHDKAAEGFREALAIYEGKLPKGHPMVPACLQALGSVYESLGDNAKALDALNRALSLIDGPGDRPDSNLSNVLTSLAMVQQNMGQDRKALDPLRRALAIREQTLPASDPEIGKAHDNLGDILEILGDPAAAVDHYLKARAIFETSLPEDHPDRGINLGSLAGAYTTLDRFDEALALYDRAIATMKRAYGPNHPRVAGYLSSQAGVLFETGDYGRALEVVTEVLALQRAQFGPKHRSVAVSLSKLGFAYARLGRPREALIRYEEALAMLRSLYGPKHPEVAANLNNVAMTRSRLGDSAGAVEAMLEALAIYRETYGDSHPNVATLHSNIGAEEVKRGRIDSAIEHGEQALAIDRARFGRVHSRVALGIYNLAMVHANRGDHRRAIAMIDEALNALAPRPDSEPRPFAKLDVDAIRPLPLAIKFLIGRGEQLEREPAGGEMVARLRETSRTYELAGAILERIRRDRVRNAASKAVIGDEAFQAFPERISALRRLHEREGRADDLISAYETAERGSARLFLESLGTSRSRDLAGVDRSTRDQEDALLDKLGRLDKSIAEEQNKPLDSRDPVRVRGLLDSRTPIETDLANLVARIERDCPRYASLNYPRPCSIQEARACLGPREVALIFVPGERESCLIVVPGQAGGDMALHRLAGSAEIAELVIALTQTKLLEDPDATRELGLKAYRMLIAPASASIRGKDLVIVPAGVLGLLPFGLVAEPDDARPDDPTTARFLIQGHQIRYAPSMTGLHLIGLWERARPRPPRDFWALGDPIYGPDDPRLTARPDPRRSTKPSPSASRGTAPKRLEASGEEVVRLKGIMGAKDDDIRVGDRAGEAALKRLSASGTLAEYRYIHFACHGVIGQEENTPPALLLTMAGDLGGEDGVLTLDEVTSIKINADLVVLSACQTGQGRLSIAEGVTGLARAFLHAGSRAVVGSLWRVDDAATSDLMADLYSGLKAGKPSADALRLAQLKMIEAGEPPLHWAPFVLIGR